jgi:hypothetical protein
LAFLEDVIQALTEASRELASRPKELRSIIDYARSWFATREGPPPAGSSPPFLKRHGVPERVNLSVKLIDFYISPTTILEFLIGNFHDAAIGSFDFTARRRAHLFLLFVPYPFHTFSDSPIFSVEMVAGVGFEPTNETLIITDL